MDINKVNSLKENSTIIISANKEIYDILGNYDINYDEIFDMLESEALETLNNLVKTINNKKINVIFYSNHYQYGDIIPKLNNNINAKWLYSNTISHFSEPYNYNWFKSIIDFYNRNNIKEILLLDDELYKILCKNYNVTLLKLNIVKNYINNNPKNKTIGIIGYDYNPYSNIYNQLSAITLTKYKSVNLLNCDGSTKEFCERFGIEYTLFDDVHDLIRSSEINLYCKFDNIKPYYFYESMNLGIPCILGNTKVLKNNKLEKYLLLDSDDDISEIADKINKIENNYNNIFKIYKDWKVKNKET